MENSIEWVSEALQKVSDKMKWVSDKNRDKIPYTTLEDGSYDDKSLSKEKGGDIAWWTNGFWGGLMWRLYELTGDADYMKIAKSSEAKLEQCVSDFYGLHHDVGFMYMPTSAADYRITGDKASLKTALHVANLLAGRFNPAGSGYIRAWNNEWGENEGWAIIDCMMNLSLLYFASEETKDPRFKNIAMKHADTVIDAFVRENGSCCHIVEFDPETGKRIRSQAGQGYAHGSSWTRGQAWGVYGFAISYLHTKEKRYLETSKRVADYCLSKMNGNYMIPVDFDQPAVPELEDGCGACVLACGFIELSRLTGEKKYFEAGEGILKAIYEKRSDFSNSCDAIVTNCSARYHEEKHHYPMVYADYYFVEGLMALQNKGIFMW